MRDASRAVYMLVGLVNLAPITGVASARALDRLYGTELDQECPAPEVRSQNSWRRSKIASGVAVQTNGAPSRALR